MQPKGPRCLQDHGFRRFYGNPDLHKDMCISHTVPSFQHSANGPFLMDASVKTGFRRLYIIPLLIFCCYNPVSRIFSLGRPRPSIGCLLGPRFNPAVWWGSRAGRCCLELPVSKED